MSIKIGITGGIGSGKSVVSRLFGIMGIPVYISDIEAKRITQTDPVICQELCALVGQDVFQNGVLNRSLLASYMFGHPNRCLLYTSDAADDLLCVDLDGRRFIKKKKKCENEA